MVKNEHEHYVLLWPLTVNERGSVKSKLRRHEIPFIELTDYVQLAVLASSGSFRVAVIDVRDADYGNYGQESTKLIRMLEHDAWPLSAIFAFGVKGQSVETKARFVHYVPYEARNDVRVWTAIKELAVSSRIYTESFNLPPDLADACAQYLLFFRKFLENIGIEASTAASNDAGTVLFSVEPKDPKLALETIHTALRVYLQLPQANYTVVTNDAIEKMKALQLGTEIDVLKNRLQLATTLLQAKDATIELKEAQIQTLRVQLEAKDELIRAKDLQIQRLVRFIFMNACTVNATSPSEGNATDAVALWKSDDILHIPHHGNHLNLADVIGAGTDWATNVKAIEMERLRELTDGKEDE